MDAQHCSMGLDVGGTKIAAGLVGFPSGDVIVRRVVPTTPQRDGPKVLEDAAVLAGSQSQEARSRGVRIGSMGIGTLQFGYDEVRGVKAMPFLIKNRTLGTGGGPQFFSTNVINNWSAYYSVSTTISPTVGTVQTARGNLGRNTHTGPGFSNLDFSIMKQTHVTESTLPQFRAEFFDILSAATFGTPTSKLLNPAFGFSTSPRRTERQIQLGLRFVF
jgi:hypothetical protein